jgi:integrase
LNAAPSLCARPRQRTLFGTVFADDLEARCRQKTGYVFTRATGDAWDPNELSRQFSRLVRRRRKLPPFRFHDLRHGYASLAFAAGVSLRGVSESLGHSAIGVTDAIYVHLRDDAKREKADRLDAYLGASRHVTKGSCRKRVVLRLVCPSAANAQKSPLHQHFCECGGSV